MRGAVIRALPACEVRYTFDEATLRCTPLGVADERFRATAQAGDAELARAACHGLQQPAQVHLQFSGVPATGTVRCRLSADGVCARARRLRRRDGYVADHGATLLEAGPDGLTVALYPPHSCV